MKIIKYMMLTFFIIYNLNVNANNEKDITVSAEISNAISEYAENLKDENISKYNSFKKQKYLTEDNKEEILGMYFSTGTNLLKDDIIKETKDKKTKMELYKILINGLKKKDGSYRLLVKTKFSRDELKNLFSKFDNISINNFFPNVYELNFSTGSNLGELLTDSIYKKGIIPDTIFENIEIVTPELVESASPSDSINTLSNDSFIQYYLSGETTDWGRKAIGADLYQYNFSQLPNIKVGIIDSGIDENHPDLKGKIDLNLSKDFSLLEGTTKEYKGKEHGTMVGSIVGSTKNGSGVYGVNSSSTLVDLRVLYWIESKNHVYGSTQSIIDSIKYAADNGIKIINLSLSGPNDYISDPEKNIFCQAITYAKSKGTISIVRAGNDGFDSINSVPARCKDAITVGAVDRNLNRSIWSGSNSSSNYGNKIDISAPGTHVYAASLNGQNELIFGGGTSAAAPFVSGVVSVMLAKDPTLTVEQIKEILRDTGINLSTDHNMGKFISMSGALSRLGVKQDSEFVTNYIPELSLSSLLMKVTDNSKKYLITTSFSDKDGKITKIEALLNGEKIYTKDLDNTFSDKELLFSIDIKNQSNLKINVYDDKGVIQTQEMSLQY